VRANRAYRLIVRRGGWAPASIADPARVDHVEVVDVASGEALLTWNLPPMRAARLARALRADLAQLEPPEFAERWIDLPDATDSDAPGDENARLESDSWV
jgi:hypothetical protein